MLIAKVMTMMAMFWVSGLLVGTSVIHQPHKNTNLGIVLSPQVRTPLAIEATSSSTNDILVAVHSEKLDEISKQLQAGNDDRRVLHDEVSTLSSRVSVDEAQLKSVGWTFGIVLSALNALHTILLVMDYRRKKGKQSS